MTDREPWWGRILAALLNLLDRRTYDGGYEAGRLYERGLWEAKAKQAEATVEDAARTVGGLETGEVVTELDKWRTH